MRPARFNAAKMASSKVTHLFTQFRSLGGVESVLQRHYAMDADWGFASRFIIYFEPETEPLARVQFLGFDRRTTIREARRRFGAATALDAPTIAVYHEMWGMPYLADLDQASRRVLLLHGQTPGMLESLSYRREWLDGVLCVNEALRQLVRPCVSHLSEGRVGVVPYPISPPPLTPQRRPLNQRPLVLGFCGRLQVQQKRVDRLPAVCLNLDQRGLNYRLEFLGDGPDRAWLENQFPDRSRFLFHGRKKGDEYWRILAEWDAILFTSDYEGTPISMLEALSVGVVPIYPRIATGGDAYAAGVRPDLLYEPGDLAHVANTLVGLARASEAEWQSLRLRCTKAVSPHVGDAYPAQFSAFVHQVAEWPKVSQANFPRRPPLVADLPFCWLERVGAGRRFFRRLAGPRAIPPLRA